MGRILAIDYGLKNTGIAITDELQLIATPLTTIPTTNLIPWLKNYSQNNNLSTILIGYPLKIKNSDNSILPNVRNFISQCKKKLPNTINITTLDERFTSTIAHQTAILTNTPKRKKQNKQIYDKIAACILLQDYLQRNKLTNQP